MTQIRPAQIAPAQVTLTEVTPAQMTSTQIGPTQMTPSEMVAQRPKPGELAAVARRMERTGGCRHPIRLVGRSRDGGYETKDEPDGVLLVACGTRHATRCPPCAYIYQGDARHVIRSGMEGGKGVPASVAEHPMAFFTLTAPSFGPVHTAKRGRCHIGPAGNCQHGRSRHCLATHLDEEEIVGAPLCSDCYDWERAVLYNHRAGDLWRRVTIYTFRHLAYCLGVTEKALRQ